MPGTSITLDRALDLTRTGDIWLFRGSSMADRAIRMTTNSPVNHVGMSVVLDDLPPLMWHAELGKGLRDVWTGEHHRGVQLHDLGEAVTQWMDRYQQSCWLRQLSAEITPAMDDALLTTIARMNGLPFPSTVGLLGRVARGRVRRRAPAELAYCAEVVAEAYIAMGLLDGSRPSNYYDPGKFWSGDDLGLELGATLGEEITVYRTERPQPW
jgi:hypothetical protein